MKPQDHMRHFQNLRVFANEHKGDEELGLFQLLPYFRLQRAFVPIDGQTVHTLYLLAAQKRTLPRGSGVHQPGSVAAFNRLFGLFKDPSYRFKRTNCNDQRPGIPQMYSSEYAYDHELADEYQSKEHPFHKKKFPLLVSHIAADGIQAKVLTQVAVPKRLFGDETLQADVVAELNEVVGTNGEDGDGSIDGDSDDDDFESIEEPTDAAEAPEDDQGEGNVDIELGSEADDGELEFPDLHVQLEPVNDETPAPADDVDDEESEPNVAAPLSNEGLPHR